jgi:DNA-binding HxlR family transcriptional regulator
VDLNPRQRSELDSLIAHGLIEKIALAGQSGPAKYAVTPKGQKVLDDRGVGSNEA